MNAEGVTLDPGAGVVTLADGGRAGACPAPEAPGTAGLPCQKRHKSDNEERKKSRPTHWRKTAAAFEENVGHLVRTFGVERLGFLTLTLGDDLSYWRKEDRKEAARRFDNFRRGFLSRERLDTWLAVIEPQKSGRLHWHLLVVLPEDIRTGVDAESFRRGDYSTAPACLKEWWRKFRKACEKYHLGRHQLEPIRKTGKELARYVGKYIAKGIEAETEACADFRDGGRIRRVRYSHGWRVANSLFGWATGGSRWWRERVDCVAQALRGLGVAVQDVGDWSTFFGKRWAYHCGPLIGDVRIDVPIERGSWGYANKLDVDLYGMIPGSIIRSGMRSGQYAAVDIAKWLAPYARRPAVGSAIRTRIASPATP